MKGDFTNLALFLFYFQNKGKGLKFTEVYGIAVQTGTEKSEEQVQWRYRSLKVQDF
jgi:hypothetical protein